MIKPFTNTFLFQRPVIGQSNVVYFLLPKTSSLHQFPIPQHLFCSGNLAGGVCSYFRRNEWVNQQHFPQSVCAREYEFMVHLLCV